MATRTLDWRSASHRTRIARERRIAALRVLARELGFDSVGDELLEALWHAPDCRGWPFDSPERRAAFARELRIVTGRRPVRS